jgi:hypothetical protein
MPKNAYLAVLRTTLWIVAGDLLFTNGFMLLRIPPVGAGVPINEVLLCFDLGILLFTRLSTGFFSKHVLVFPLAILWLLASVQFLFGVHQYGIWAIRDAANVMESGFLFVGYCFAWHPSFTPRFTAWLRRVLNFAAFYILLYPVQDSLARFSPSVPSMSGYEAPLLFSYGNPASVAITSACRLLISGGRRQLPKILLSGLLIMCVIVFVQVRIAYFQIGLLILLVAAFQPRRMASLGAMALAVVVLTGLFLASGIQLPGRLGETFTLDFLLNHFQAIWGGGGKSTIAAAEGVDLRLNWWIKIDQDLHQHLSSWLFGLGYGMPLTSFHGPTDDIVREPHNSFVSVYGRLGVVGLLAFLAVQINTVVSAVRLITQTRSNPQFQACAITLLCFIGVSLIYSFGEGGLEVSFIAVPYYFFSGVLVSFEHQHSLRPAAQRRTTMSPAGTLSPVSVVAPYERGRSEVAVHVGEAPE